MARISHKWTRLLWTLAALFLTVYVVRAFVADVHVVRSSSMEPTLYPGDYVLVLRDRSPPERYAPIVLKQGDDLVVKRAAGLPGETVLVDDSGDLRIDSRRMAVDSPRPEPIPVFDASRQRVEDYFHMGGTAGNPWHASGEVWELDARDVKRGAALGMMGLHKGLHDDHFDQEGELVYGQPPIDVGDAIVECRFMVVEPGGRMRLVLDERGDSFQFSVELEAGGMGSARLTRVIGGKLRELEVLDEVSVPVPVGEWTLVRFANVDNVLWVEYGEDPIVLYGSYAENSYFPRDINRVGYSRGQRVHLGGEECLIRVRDIRVWRDLHYTLRGEYAVKRPFPLGPDEYFFLGDNSALSKDSREWGPVKRGSIYGRATWVVWPPSAVRRLDATPPLAVPLVHDTANTSD